MDKKKIHNGKEKGLGKQTNQICVAHVNHFILLITIFKMLFHIHCPIMPSFLSMYFAPINTILQRRIMIKNGLKTE